MLSARGIAVVVGAENHSSMLGGLGGGFLSLDIWVAEEDSDEAAALLRDLREPGLGRAGFHDDDDLDDCDHRDADDDTHDADEGGDARRSAHDADEDRETDDDARDPQRSAHDADEDRDPRRSADDDDDGRDPQRSAHDADDGPDGDALACSAHVASDAFHLRIDRRRRTGIALLLGCCITFGTAHMFTRAWLRGIALGALELVGILQVAAGHRAGTIAIVGAVAADVIGAVWRVWAAPPSVLPEARLRRR